MAQVPAVLLRLGPLVIASTKAGFSIEGRTCGKRLRGSLAGGLMPGVRCTAQDAVSVNTHTEATMLKGFKEFLMRGNVIDLAVAVVIGAAFGAVVTAFVTNILTPLIAAIVGKPDFSAL